MGDTRHLFVVKAFAMHRKEIKMRVCSVVVVILACGCQGQSPILSKIHTVSIHVKDLQTFNNVFCFLKDDLDLPVKWGREWTPEDKAKKKYAACWAGNICIEPCGPYENDQFDGNSKAMFFAITFLPYKSAQSSASGLDARGIQNGGPAVFLLIPDPLLSSNSTGVCIMDTGVEEREKDNAANNKKLSELVARQGGPLGLIRVEEIRVRYKSEESLKQWKNFLKPVKPVGKNLYRIAESPAIRFIKSQNMGIESLVWKVRSLSVATDYLKGRGMLGDIRDDQIQIANEKACGLTRTSRGRKIVFCHK